MENARELIWKQTEESFYGRDIFHHSEIQKGKV